MWAIVPAAGTGRRFRAAAGASPGTVPKQLHDIGGRTMLAAVLDALDASRVAAVIVVVNRAIAAPIAAERAPSARRVYVVNPRENSEMIESIQLGLAAVHRHYRLATGERDGYLVCPGDLPEMNPAVIDRCIDTFVSAPDRIVIAACRGRAGHPIILPADVARDVATWPPTQRLNTLRSTLADRVTLVETGEPGAVRDVDTPADLGPCGAGQ